MWQVYICVLLCLVCLWFCKELPAKANHCESHSKEVSELCGVHVGGYGEDEGWKLHSGEDFFNNWSPKAITPIKP